MSLGLWQHLFRAFFLVYETINIVTLFSYFFVYLLDTFLDINVQNHHFLLALI